MKGLAPLSLMILVGAAGREPYSVGSTPTNTRNGDVIAVSRPDVAIALTREATLRAVHDGWQAGQTARLSRWS